MRNLESCDHNSKENFRKNAEIIIQKKIVEKKILEIMEVAYSSVNLAELSNGNESLSHTSYLSYGPFPLSLIFFLKKSFGL